MAQPIRAWMVLTAVVGVFAACGSDTVEPNPAVAPFVGTWDADSLTITNIDPDTTIVANILEFGSFFIVIEPSGTYTATLTYAGAPIVEVGQLSVSGSTITLAPTTPAGGSPATSSYSFVGSDFLILDGPTDFDFNLDGESEPALAHFELRKR